jgi:hypothetical protein
MKYIISFFVLCNFALADNPYLRDEDGNVIQPTKLPISSVRKNIYLKDLAIGEHFDTDVYALSIDTDGSCWLNPKHVISTYNKGDLHITRTKFGYVVMVNYHYKKVDGYSIATWNKWEPTVIPENYIPVKSIVIVKRHEEISPFRKRTIQLQDEEYHPRFKKSVVAPNPYSMEKQHVRPSNPSFDASPSSTNTSSPGADLLEKLNGIK